MLSPAEPYTCTRPMPATRCQRWQPATTAGCSRADVWRIPASPPTLAFPLLPSPPLPLLMAGLGRCATERWPQGSGPRQFWCVGGRVLRGGAFRANAGRAWEGARFSSELAEEENPILVAGAMALFGLRKALAGVWFCLVSLVATALLQAADYTDLWTK